MISVRISVNTDPDASIVVASEVGISPVVVIVHRGGGGGGVRSPEGISPAQAVPESMHARTTANANCLILSLSPLS